MKAMFVADAPIEHKAPVVKRKMPAYAGIAQFVSEFETEKPEPRPPFEDVLERRVSRPRRMGFPRIESVDCQAPCMGEE